MKHLSRHLAIALLASASARAAGTMTLHVPATVMAQERVVLTVTGGTPDIRQGYCYYTVTTDNKAIAAVSCTRTVQYDVRGVAPGTSIITVRDKTGATVTKSITVVKGEYRLDFPDYLTYTGAPSFQYLTPRGGGNPPFYVEFSVPGVLELLNYQPTRPSFLVKIGKPGTVTITVKNAAGWAASKTVKVVDPHAGQPLAFAVGLPSAGLKTNLQHALSPRGGKPPYTFSTSSSNLKIAGSPPSGMVTFVPGTYSVTLRDAAGATQTKTFAFVNNEAIQGLTLGASKDSLTVGDEMPLTVSGGTPPYSFQAPPELTVLVRGGTFHLRGEKSTPAGPVLLKVRDSKGAGGSKSFRVQAADLSPVLTLSPGTILVGEPATLIVTGRGTPPYSASDSTGTVSITPAGAATFRLVGSKPGVANLAVRDGKGNTGRSALTVKAKPAPPKVPALRSVITRPDLYLTGMLGRVRILMVSGGSTPYTVTSSSRCVKVGSGAKTATGSWAYELSAVSAGPAVISIKDASGQTRSVSVTVSNGKDPGK